MVEKNQAQLKVDLAMRRNRLLNNLPSTITAHAEPKLQSLWNSINEHTQRSVILGASVAVAARNPDELSILIENELDWYHNFPVAEPVSDSDRETYQRFEKKPDIVSASGVPPDREEEAAVGRILFQRLEKLTQTDEPFTQMQTTAAILIAQLRLTAVGQDDDALQNLRARMKVTDYFTRQVIALANPTNPLPDTRTTSERRVTGDVAFIDAALEENSAQLDT